MIAAKVRRAEFFLNENQLLQGWASQEALVVKNPSVDVRDAGSIPGSGRSPGGAQGNPLQYPCLENPMDRGARGLQSRGSQRVEHN